MIVDARNREINLGSHVRYVDTGTVGEVTDSKVENDASWVKIDKTNLWYLANKLELLNDEDLSCLNDAPFIIDYAMIRI